MRKLMWFSIGFAVACGVSLSVWIGAWAILLALVFLVSAFALRTVPTVKSKVCALLLMGAAIGFLWVFGYEMLYLTPAAKYDGKTVEESIEITDYSFSTGMSTCADAAISIDGKRYPIRIYWSAEESLAPGDRLDGEVYLRWTARGGLEEPTHHSGSGVLFLGYVSDTAVLHKEESSSWVHFPAKLRKGITETIDAIFPEDVAGFARALLIGDTSALIYGDDVALQLSGIRHVVAVSGLHVSILFSLAYTMAGKRRIWTAVLGIPVLVLFAAVAGFTPSVLRACVMQILMILSLLLNKDYDPPTALATAVLCILACNPILVTSVSLQLSVGCIIGIFLFATPIHDWLLRGKLEKLAKGKRFSSRMLRWILSTVAVSISASVATLPLVAYHFGTISLVGILTNVLTLWIISFLFYGIMLCSVTGALFLPAARVLAWVIAWGIRYVLLIARWLSSLPLAAVYTCSIYVVIWLVMVYVLLAVFLWAKKKHPVLFSACVSAGLALAILAGWLEPKISPVHATVLDVGQGQCVLLYASSGTYMVDCGGEYGKNTAAMASALLRTQGVTHLDGLILTHYDLDHANGAGYFLSRFPVDRLYLPDIADDGNTRRELEQNWQDRITWIREDTCLAEELSLFPALEGENENESSLSVLFQKENCDILITGDLGIAGEKTLLQDHDLPGLELLVAGHHGSDTSNGHALLKQTLPKQVAISVGGNNPFGHPSQIVTERLKYYGCRIWRTDLDGTIHFRG